MDARAVTEAIPPNVRRNLEGQPPPRHEGRDIVFEFGPWFPRAPACHLLPSLALLTPRRYAVRFEVSGRRSGAWTSWVGTTTLGDDGFAPLPAAADGLTVDIDEIHASPPIDAVRLRVRVGGDTGAVAGAPTLVTLSVWDGAFAPKADTPLSTARLSVPARTQLCEPETVRLRICAPTSVGMAMEYFGRAVPTMTLADAVFHAPTDRYGVWPAAVRVAAAHGVPGYLLRFPDWEAAAWCLARGLPIVASVRFSAGELTNAPIPETTGHLVVITGLDGDEVLVNDPVAPEGSVSRRYRREEFTRVWLDRTGVGVVFFPA
jgi:hypothetical protein